MNKICLKCGNQFQGTGDICPNCIARKAESSHATVSTKKYEKDSGLFQKFFRIGNRINRMQFLTRTLIIILCNTALLLYCNNYIDTRGLTIGQNTGAVEGILLGVWILSFISFLTLMVRRLHDMEKSGGWIIVAWIVPFAIFYLLYKLFFSSGTDGENEYGAKPE